MSKTTANIEEMMEADAGKGKGTSLLPSANASPLDLNEVEWQWIDAVYYADKTGAGAEGKWWWALPGQEPPL